MIEHQLTQGSPEWHAHRAQYRNASDTPAVMGHSPYITRSEFMEQRATGIVPEIDAATQRRFDDGHKFEALARPLMEQIIGEDLFPIVGSEGLYSASFDGLTMFADTAAEHKTLNDTIRACSIADELPAMYREQMEHQMMVSGAGRCLFMATKWSAAGELEEMVHFWYEPDMELRAMICAAWDQFAADLAAYQHVEVIPAAVAAPVNELPALAIEITGNVVASNLAQWRGIVTERISAINTVLESDQDFADADKMVKFLDDGEKKIDLVKAQSQAQAVSIDEVFRALDEIKATMRTKRLELDKLVKARKENIRGEIAQGGMKAYAEHCAALNARLKGQYLPGQITAAFADVMKGKKTVASLRDAVSTELARVKIESNALADKIDANLTRYGELAVGFEFLFRDLFSLVLQPAEAFDAMVQQRISQHQEQKRREEEATRERIRAEEQAKAQREAAEQQRQKDAAEAKAKADAAIAEEERLLVLARQQQTDQATVSQNGASSPPEFPAVLSPAEAVAQSPAPSAVLPAAGAASVTRADAWSLVYDEIDCALTDMNLDELKQVAHFIDRLQLLRKAA